MKITKTTSALTALALAAVLSTSAHAQSTYNEGDILLGFQQPGATNDYVVDLGAVSQFINASSSLTFNISTTDLTTAFGSSWANNTPAGSVVQWGLIGASDNNGSSIVVGGDTLKEDTLFVTKVGTAPATHGDGSQNSINNTIQAFAGDWESQTVTGNGGAIYSTSDSNGYSANNPYTSAFGIGYGIEQAATLGVNGPTDSTLNLYQLNDTTDTPGATAKDIGSFGLSTGGVLTFTPESVPEPSSFALGSVAFALMVVLLARQRKAQPLQ